MSAPSFYCLLRSVAAKYPARHLRRNWLQLPDLGLTATVETSRNMIHRAANSEQGFPGMTAGVESEI